MAIYNANGNLIEFPLIFNDPKTTKQMADLRDKIEKLLGPSAHGPLKGLREGDDGQWLGVYEKSKD